MWSIASLVILVLLLAIALTIPAVQNFAKNKAISYLKKKTNTEISLERIRISFPTGLQLDNFFIQDQKKDTLLYAGKLSVQLDMLALLRSRISVSDIKLQTVNAKVYRTQTDAVFNYQFLVDAFASTETEPEKSETDSTAPLQLTLGSILLEDIHLMFKDDVAGTDAGLSLGRLYTKVNKFDLEQMHYVLNKLDLQNTNLHYFQTKPLAASNQQPETTSDNVQNESGGKLPLIEVGAFAFNNVNIHYDDDLSEMRALALLKTFSFKNLLIDLEHGKYESTDAELSNSTIEFAYRSAPAEPNKKDTTDSTESTPFSLSLKNIVLSNNAIKYDDIAAPEEKGVMDFNRLNIIGLGITGKNILMDSTGISASVIGGKLKESSGFVLNDLNGTFDYNDKQIKVKDLSIKTPNSYIDNNTLLTYSAIGDLTKHPERVNLSIDFQKSVLGLKDAAYFTTTIPADYHHQQLHLSATILGRMSDIRIGKFQLSGLGNTNMSISGNIKGLPDMDKAFFNINIAKFNTSKSDLNALLPKGTLPEDMELPNQIAATGKFTGSLNKFSTHLDVITDIGTANLNASMGGSSKNPSYTAKINLNNFDVGYLLKRDDVGKLSLNVDLAGSGTTAQTANVTVKGTVADAYYNQYNYQNIILDGKYANQLLQLKANSSDTNVNFALNTTINMAEKHPSLKGDFDLKNLDLQKLNFASSEMKIRGLASIDFPTLNPDSLNGTAHIANLQVIMDGRNIQVDTIFLNALSTATENSLQLQSDILDFNINGKYQLTQIGQAFINEINKYYAFAPTQKIAPQQMNFGVVVHDSKILKEFVPELHVFRKSTLSGAINTATDSLVITASFPHIVYDSFDIKNTTLIISNQIDTSEIQYALEIQSMESPSIALYNAAINGNALNDTLGVNVFLRDRKNQDKYTVGGHFNVNNSTYQFSLDPDKLLLNYDKWKVAPDNLIQYGQAGVFVRNFEIGNSGQSLSVNSTATTVNSPVEIRFGNFELETLTRYAEQDTALVGGILNGSVNISNLASDPKFATNLNISKLRFQKDQLGDVKLVADNNTPDAYRIDLTLSDVHEARINGFYYTTDDGSLDMDVNVDRFDLKQTQSLSAGQITYGYGFASGNLSVKGPLASPKVLGSLHFKNAGVNVAQLNSLFKLDDESIAFSETGIRFNNFTLKDSADQSFTLNGMIKTTDYENFGFDLRLRSTNFRVLNSTAADNPLFYGKVYVTLNTIIGGDLNKPEVTGSLRINKDTRFFFAIPDEDPGIVNQEGIVEFIDMDAPPSSEQAVNVDSLTRSPLTGFNLSMDLQTEKEAEVTVIVDPQNGDALLLKGEAELNVTMDPSGKIAMTGRYLISEGNYNLSVGGLAKRKFQLQQGSFIQWTGAPTEANIDLTAIYNVSTSAIDLIGSEVQSADESSKVMYRQKLPFIVYLKMTDQLLKPKISFQIDLPENERNAFGGIVNARLMQINGNESEVNKQVFALLALNKFISENPFASLTGGTSPEMLARQSVSRLLTQQLNNLAADLVKGVDLSFDLNSQDDYSTGSQQTRTDLEVNLSKRFLDDRLSVTIGSDFALEGAGSKNKNGTNLAGDVNIEYMLSRDGRYRLRAYRRNQSELVIEGQIIETGLGFIMVADYNRFKDAFRSLKSEKRLIEEREKRRKQREAASRAGN